MPPLTTRVAEIPGLPPEAWTLSFGGTTYTVEEVERSVSPHGMSTTTLRLRSPTGEEAGVRYYGSDELAEFRMPHLSTVCFDPPRPAESPESASRRAMENARVALIRTNRQRAAELRERIAERRARRLLEHHLSSDQAEEWERTSRFTVCAAASERLWRIAPGWEGNIYLLANPRGIPTAVSGGRLVSVGEFICVAVRHATCGCRTCSDRFDSPPVYNNLLGIKLMFEAEGGEELVLAAAN